MFVASCVHCLILKLVYSKQEDEVNTYESKRGIIWTDRFWIQQQSFRFVMLAFMLRPSLLSSFLTSFRGVQDTLKHLDEFDARFVAVCLFLGCFVAMFILFFSLVFFPQMHLQVNKSMIFGRQLRGS